MVDTSNKCNLRIFVLTTSYSLPPSPCPPLRCPASALLRTHFPLPSDSLSALDSSSSSWPSRRLGITGGVGYSSSTLRWPLARSHSVMISAFAQVDLCWLLNPRKLAWRVWGHVIAILRVRHGKPFFDGHLLPNHPQRHREWYPRRPPWVTRPGSSPDRSNQHHYPTSAIEKAQDDVVLAVHAMPARSLSQMSSRAILSKKGSMIPMHLVFRLYSDVGNLLVLGKITNTDSSFRHAAPPENSPNCSSPSLCVISDMHIFFSSSLISRSII
jgi:hypothetical protein